MLMKHLKMNWTEDKKFTKKKPSFSLFVYNDAEK